MACLNTAAQFVTCDGSRDYSYIDNIDAEMMMMTTALSRIDEGEMTNRIFAMDNRSFYKPKL